MHKAKKFQLVFIIYWFLLAYIVAALIFWFIELNKQNQRMADFKLNDFGIHNNVNHDEILKIRQDKKRKTAQYIGEGVTFFLVILVGAIIVFRAVRRQLKQSQQQQNFMIAITHELKTPIAVAQLNLETLQKRKLDEAQQRRLIQITLQETNRLNALCNNMLLTSQIEAGGYRMTKEEVNFSELLEVCIGDFNNRFQHEKIRQEVQPGLFVSGDALLLQMAVNNLIDNAIKYSDRASVVSVQLSEEKNNIVLQVTDEGIGINEAEKKKIFEKFYRAGNEATKSAKGTGLGLYLTFKVIKAHKGTISIKDNVPAGSIFIINLDAAEKTL
jgi:signal transduction histidine kinase